MSYFTIIAALFLVQIAKSAETEVWTSASIEQKIDEKFGTFGEFLYRHSQEVQDFKVAASRIGLTYKLDEKWKSAFIVENRSTDSSGNNELRNILQASRGFDFESFKLTTRLRWELRRFADSEVTMNRFRFFARVDLNTLKITEWTPYVSIEPFFITNSVASRPAGSRELRNQIGLSGQFLNGVLDIAYMYRQQTSPATDSAKAKDSRYNILNLSLKYSL